MEVITLKPLLARLLSLALLLTLMGSSCEKEELSPLEQLPAATQEGKNTFGCLVNGQVFVPTGQLGFGIPPYSWYYQQLTQDYNPVKGYMFRVSASDWKGQNKPSIGLGTYSLELKEGTVYPLGEPSVVGKAYGEYTKIAPVGLENYSIVSPLTGEMRITKFDKQKRIVSGTFWFDAVNAAGEKVEVREGRFDMGL